jgi:5'-3' exonuclease
MEADDALGIAQTTDTILCTIDKDLDQISGKHYNFVQKRLYSISEEEGLKWFYKQILIGDNADGIKGLRGIGPVKADKHINPLKNEAEYYSKVLELYKQHYPEDYTERLIKNGQLLKIRRTKDEGIWQPPNERSDATEAD